MKAFLHHRLVVVVPLTMSLLLLAFVTPVAQTLNQHKFTHPFLSRRSCVGGDPVGFFARLDRGNKSKATGFCLAGSQYYASGMSKAGHYLEKLADFQNSRRIAAGVALLIIGMPLAGYGIHELEKGNDQDGTILTASGASLSVLGIFLMHGKSRAQKSFERVLQTNNGSERHQIALQTLRFYARTYRVFRMSAVLISIGGGIWALTLPTKEKSFFQSEGEQKLGKARVAVLCFASAILFLFVKTVPEKLYSEYRKETRDIYSLKPSLALDGKGRVYFSFSHSF